MQRGRADRSYRWSWIAALWSGFALIDATQTVLMMRAEGMHHPWPKLFGTIFVSWLPWMLATPWVMRLAEKFPPVKLHPLRPWLIHAGGCAALGLTAAAWAILLDILFNPYGYPSPSKAFLMPWLQKFYSGTLSWLVLYAAIVVVSHVLASKARLAVQETEAARLNELLSEAQLSALRRQIEPHFLFNTLNAVAGLVRERRNDDAVSMIAELSEYLRGVLAESTRQQVTLHEEVEFTRKFLNIQKLRFAERLQISMNVPIEVQRAQVPTLILQPMVENAIKHGIAKRVHGGELRIVAARNNGMLTLRVYNDGPGLAETPATGIGISNVRARLESLYGSEFELSMKNCPPSGVEARLSLPFKE